MFIPSPPVLAAWAALGCRPGSKESCMTFLCDFGCCSPNFQVVGSKLLKNKRLFSPASAAHEERMAQANKELAERNLPDNADFLQYESLFHFRKSKKTIFNLDEVGVPCNARTQKNPRPPPGREFAVRPRNTAKSSEKDFRPKETSG